MPETTKPPRMPRVWCRGDPFYFCLRHYLHREGIECDGITCWRSGADSGIFAVQLWLEMLAHKVWSKARTGLVEINKKGDVKDGLILADNTNSDAIVIPTCEEVERIKKAENNPRWYRCTVTERPNLDKWA